MTLYPYASSSRTSAPKPAGTTEFEILKAAHKFLREEDEPPSTWDEKLAGKYYSNLYREFAVCDLKHYKSGNFALRWRTEDEVLSGSGETTCGNTRCEYHFAPRFREEGSKIPLTTLELPFAYVEHGESKSALVKVVLCRRCVKKLMWKRSAEKEKAQASAPPPDSVLDADAAGVVKVESEEEGNNLEALRQKKRSREDGDEKERTSRRRRRSRSKSPRHSRHSRGESSLSKHKGSPKPS